MQFDITGMSCAACSQRIEKAVSSLDGVSSCQVNLLTNSMTVEGQISDESVISAVESAGYGAKVKGSTPKNTLAEIDRAASTLKIRLVFSVTVLLALMYLSMGHNMLNLPIPRFLEANPVSNGITQLLLSALVMIANQRFFINGAKGLLHKAPNMDTLVALGSSSAFIYSAYSLFIMSAHQNTGELDVAYHYLHELYFESAAMILALITVGKMLEAMAKGKTTNAIKALIDMSPKSATVIRNGKEIRVPIDEVKENDVFILKPGDSVPVDGIVTDGVSAINESALTGESLPVDKAQGDKVYCATINQSGYLTCKATKVGQDTTLSQIIKMVSDAQTTKAPISKIADKVSGIFVPIVLTLSLLTFVIWLAVGQPLGFSVSRAISVLVISCPCALGLATPVAIMVGSGVGARNGILFKTAASLEKTGKIKTVALDKTGTVTLGEMSVTDIIPTKNFSKNELLSLAASLESKSEHPLARAITETAEKENLTVCVSSDFLAISGKGVAATLSFHERTACAHGGNAEFIEQFSEIPSELKSMAQKLSTDGKTPLYFEFSGELVGIIAVADTVKEDSAKAIAELKSLGIRTVMLTGDNGRTASAIAKQVGIDEIISGVLPEEKLNKIQEFKKDGGVIMVGDGINDAPALSAADIGIAIGAGTDVAIESADVVLIKNGLTGVVKAIKLSRHTLKNIRENLFWAFFYNTVSIPIAAGTLYFALGLTLNPMLGAAAMSLSSFCVVMNALRLNLVKLERNQTKDKKEIKNMVVTLNIEGMMCPHCEATVKKCLEAIPGVDEATVNHKNGTAVVRLNGKLDTAVLKKAVEDKGYEVK